MLLVLPKLRVEPGRQLRIQLAYLIEPLQHS
jgi:hypothetical protein